MHARGPRFRFSPTDKQWTLSIRAGTAAVIVLLAATVTSDIELCNSPYRIGFIGLVVYSVSAIAGRKRSGIDLVPQHDHFRQQLLGRLRVQAHPDIMLAMSPVEFEQFVLDYFKVLGYETHHTIRYHDGGIDGFLFKGRRVELLQCKRHNRPVAEVPIREFLGLITKHNAHCGYVVATCGFTPAAHQFAEGTRVVLIDGQTLTSSIRSLV